MPYKVFRTNGQYCVYKIDASGQPTGKTLGCHPTLEKATAQQRALYANEQVNTAIRKGAKR